MGSKKRDSRQSSFTIGLLLIPISLFLASIWASSESSVKENLDLPYSAVGAGEEEEDGPEIVYFYGQAYEVDAVVFALDESGSMNNQGRWQLQTREVTRAINDLSTRTEFGLVFYASRVTAFKDSPLEATQGIKQLAKNFILSRTPQGDTCLGEGVIKALEIVRKSQHKRRSVIVTSDGRPDVCSSGNEANPDQIQQIIQRTLSANPGLTVTVHTIWVGEVNEPQAVDFMKRLAAAHGGTFRRVSQ